MRNLIRFIGSSVHRFIKIGMVFALVGMSGEKSYIPEYLLLPEISATSQGAASTVIPIKLPPGFSPPVGLVYNSTGANGMLGIGWGMQGFTSISRDIRTGILYNASDKFISPDGVLYQSGSVYRGRENGNTTYQLIGNPADPDGFIATAPNKTRMYFGTTANSKIMAAGRGVGRVWALNKAEDANGNSYTVEYLEVDGEFYPSSLRYYSTSGNTEQKVIFSYENRPDAITAYTYSAAVTMTKRLDSIEVMSGGRNVRTFLLSYLAGIVTGNSRLALLEERGPSDEEIRRIHFEYQEGGAGFAVFSNQSQSDQGGFGPGADDPNRWRFAEFNGDGRDDGAWIGGGYVSISEMRNNGFNLVLTVTQTSLGAGGSGADDPNRWIFTDFTSDGKADAMWIGNGRIIVSKKNGGFSSWSNQHQSVLGATGGGADDPLRWKIADFNGDAKPDLAWVGGGQIIISLNNGNGFSQAYTIAQTDFGAYGPGADDSNRWMFADLTGDGRSDAFWLGGGSLYLSRWNGAGFTSLASQTQASLGAFGPGADDLGRWRFADVNGDGLSDIVWIGGGRFITSVNTGLGFVQYNNQAQSELGAWGPGADDVNRYRFGEWTGDGKTDALWVGGGFVIVSRSNGLGFTTFSSQAQSELGAYGPGADDVNRYRFSEFNGDGKTDTLWIGGGSVIVSMTRFPQSDLLTSIYNNYRRSSVIYSYVFDLAGAVVPGSSAPPYASVSLVKWLPVQTDLSIAGTARERKTYTFFNAKAYMPDNPLDRRSLGFARMEERKFIISNGSPLVAPGTRITYFSQNERNAGSVLREDTVYADGNVIQRKETNYFLFDPPFAGSLPLSLVERTVETNFNSDGTFLFSKTIRNTNFDVYGNPRVIYDDQDNSTNKDDLRKEIQYSYDLCSTGLPVSLNIYDSSNQSIKSTNTVYNSVCQPERVISGGGGATEEMAMAYFPNGQLRTKTINNQTTSYIYEGERTIENAPDGTTRENQLDPATGDIVWDKTPDDRYTAKEYDIHGRVTRECRGLSRSCSGNPIWKATDYGDLGGLGGNFTITDSNGVTETVTVSQLGLVTDRLVSDDRGTTSQHMEYDVFGRQLSIEFTGTGAPSVVIRRNFYDPNGNLIRIERPGPNGIISQSMDLMPRRVPVGTQGGYEKTIVDANGQPMYEARDINDRVLRRDFQTTDNGIAQWGRIEKYYDVKGNLEKIRRGYGSSRDVTAFNPKYEINFTYDPLGRKLSQSDAESGLTTYTYDPNSKKVAAETTADGKTTYFFYDAQQRLIQIKDNNLIVVATYTYYNDGPHKSKVASIVDETGITTFQYDMATGKVADVLRSFEEGKVFDVRFEYDDQGRTIKKSYPGAEISLVYTYFNTGLLESITLNDPRGRILESGTSIVLAEYSDLNAFNKPGHLEYGNGVTLNWTYDSGTGLLRTSAAENSDGPIQQIAYSYRNDGLIAQITDQLDNKYSESYQYDSAHRLVSATGPFGDVEHPIQTIAYKYAADGQILYNGENDSTYTYTGPNTPHRLASTSDGVSYAYNARGSVTQKKFTIHCGPNDGHGNGNGLGNGNGNPPANGFGNCGTGVQNVSLNDGMSDDRGRVNQGHGNPDREFTLNMEYTFHNRVQRAQVFDSEGPDSDTKYLYTEAGDRFKKEFKRAGHAMAVEYYPDASYRVHILKGEEKHELIVEKPDGALGTFTFDFRQFTGGHGNLANLYFERLTSVQGNSPDAWNSRIDKAMMFVRVWDHSGAAGIALLLLFVFWASVAFPRSRRMYVNTYKNIKIYILTLPWNDFGRETLKTAVTPFRSAALFTIYAVFIVFNFQNCSANGAFNGAFPYGGDLSSLSQGLTGSYFFLTDHVHSTRLVTDATGKVQTRYVYMPFGRLNPALTNNDVDGDGVGFSTELKFTGQEYDFESGLYNYHARLYDPATGRFLQTDPQINDLPGFASFDAYAYTANNPINMTDPSGEYIFMVAGFLGFAFAVVQTVLAIAVLVTLVAVSIAVSLIISAGAILLGAAVIAVTVTTWLAGAAMYAMAAIAGLTVIGAVGAAALIAAAGIQALIAAGTMTSMLASAAIQMITSIVGVAFIVGAGAIVLAMGAIIQLAMAGAMIAGTVLQFAMNLDGLGFLGGAVGGLYGGLQKSSFKDPSWDPKAAAEGAKQGFVLGTGAQAAIAAVVGAYYACVAVCGWIMEQILFPIADALYSTYLFLTTPVVGQSFSIAQAYSGGSLMVNLARLDWDAALNDALGAFVPTLYPGGFTGIPFYSSIRSYLRTVEIEWSF